MAQATKLHHDQATRVDPRFTRRVLAKAAAGFAAATAFASGGAPATTAAISTETTTRGAEWWAPEGVGGTGDAIEFTADHAFRAIAPHWAADPTIEGAVEISVSADGATWTDPVVIGPALADAGPADREGRVFGHLLMTSESWHARVRTLDANGEPATLPGLALTYIDASAGPSLDDVSAPATGIGGGLVEPPIITRDQWGAGLAYGGVDAGTDGWTAEYRTVEHIVIHHSDTPSFRDPLVELRSIHYYHAISRGWGDIGYNYLVDYLGNVYEGRKGGENVVGGHAYQYAYGSAGICSMGNFSLETSTPEAIGALVWISAWAGRELDPLGKKDFHETPNCPTICGHRDVVNSSCPGDGLYADLPYIRTAVAEVLTGSRNAELPSDYSGGDVVETTVDEANLRSKPGLEGAVEAKLPRGKVLTIVEGPTTTDGYVWYRVSGDSSAGWLATTTFAPSASTAPERTYENGTKVEVATNLLNIRSAPNQSSTIVGTLPQGDVATVVGGPETGGNVTWLQVDTNIGTGWVDQEFIAPSGGRTWISSAFTVGDTVRVSDDNLNMRVDATTRAALVAQLPLNTIGRVVDGPRSSAGKTWLEISTDLGTGWVVDEYLSEGEAPPPAEAKFAVGDQVVVDTDNLNMRREAGNNSRVIVQLWHGVVGTVVDVPVTRDGYTWYRIETDEGDGWVVETFLAAATSADAPASGFEPGTAVTVIDDNVFLRNSASTQGSVVVKLNNGAAGSVVGGTMQTEGYTWVEATFDGNTGWIATAFLGRSTASPAYSGNLEVGMTAEITSDKVNVRPSASLSSTVNGQLYSGHTVTIVDGPVSSEGYTWFKVEGRWSGWVVSSWLAPLDAAGINIGSTVRVFGGELNLRSGPSTADAVEAVLPDGAVVEVLDGPQQGDGHDWYRVSSSRYGTGWAVADWLERA